MKKANKGIKAIQVFYDFERLENRLPEKSEFDLAFYGRELRRGESNYYYQAKREFLKEMEGET